MKGKMKLVAVILSGIMIFGGVVSCKKQNSDAMTIRLLQAGYGAEWLDNVIAGFNARYPEISIDVDPGVQLTSNIIEAELTGGDNKNDLYLIGDFSTRKYINAQGESDYLEDLTEMFQEKVIGEEITLKQKMNSDYYYFTEYKGKNWSTQWAVANCGLYLNKKALENSLGSNYTLPRTSDEMIKMIEDVSAVEKTTADKKAKVFPVIWSGKAWDYWRYVLNVWWAQYEGVEKYKDFWNCENEDGEKTPLVYKQEGILKALEILSKVLLYDYSYTGSLVLPHTDAEAQFFLNRAVLTVSGDWMETEMKKNYTNSDIIYLKTPVNSALGNKLGITEEQLVSVIEAVDNGISSVNGISNEIFNVIKEAREITFSIGSNHNAFIPKSSNHKDSAKLFLRYLASDEAMKIQYEACNTSSPYNLFIEKNGNYYNSLTEFQKNNYNVTLGSCYIFFDYTDPIRYLAGLQQFYGPSNQPELCFAAQQISQRKTAEQVWNDEYNQVSGSWQSYMSAAGYIQ